MLEALEQVATGEVTIASRDVELDGVAGAQGRVSRSRGGRGGGVVARLRRGRLRRRRAPARGRPRGADDPHRRGRARAGRHPAPARGEPSRASSSTSSRAASRTIPCCSRRVGRRRDRPDPDPARRGQRRLPPGARAPARAARRASRSSAPSTDGTRGRGCLRGARAGRRRDGLSAARDGRRRGDGGAAGGASGDRSRLPDGVREPAGARGARRGRRRRVPRARTSRSTRSWARSARRRSRVREAT